MSTKNLQGVLFFFLILKIELKYLCNIHILIQFKINSKYEEKN